MTEQAAVTEMEIRPPETPKSRPVKARRQASSVDLGNVILAGFTVYAAYKSAEMSAELRLMERRAEMEAERLRRNREHDRHRAEQVRTVWIPLMKWTAWSIAAAAAALLIAR